MGKPIKDLTGQQFGKLTVIKYINNSKWLCQCECGNIVEVKTNSLKSGKTKSCGCLRGQSAKGNTRNQGPRQDLTGKTFGYLTPFEYIKGGKWKCRCKCGNITIVDTRNLKNGHTQSCGCLLKEHNHKYIKDLTDFETDTLKVLEFAGVNKNHQALWKCLCKRCGNTFIACGKHITQYLVKSCGCLNSYNESKIAKLLSDNNIEFKQQYTFSDLLGVNGGHLRFDFAIFSNGKLSHLIEYNGSQHYNKPNNTWGDNFETLQQHDKLKQEYCKKHSIELRIIRYDQEYTLKDLI